MVKIDREKIFWRKVDDEIVVLNIGTGFYYSLDEIASFIWSEVAAGEVPEAIAAHLTEAYEIDVRTAQKDLKGILEYFKKEGLIF